jgi:hypothetical protein
LLAGHEPDECVGSYVIALYVFLLVVALMLFFAWVACGPMGHAA